MGFLKYIITNGYILILPLLLWNLIFFSKLPFAYQPENFDSDIPRFIVFGENIFRAIVFTLPVLFKIGITKSTQKHGLIIFSVGVVLYFFSWLMLIYMPDSWWCKSLIGFSAPAFTPMIWLIGISFMVEGYYFLPYSRWHYILPAILFAIFHILHVIFVYNKYY